MNIFKQMAVAAAALMAGGKDSPVTVDETAIPIKPRRRFFTKKVKRKPVHTKDCVQCNAPHTHNNRWCSADCCEAYRNERGDTIGTSSERRVYRKEFERNKASTLAMHEKYYGA